MTNPLRPEAIVQGMANALPTHEKGDTTSDISSSYEALALFTHACMASLGFRLLGFNEDQKMESECQRLSPRLPPKWNASFNSHSFLYAHSQSSMQYIIKIDRLGGKAEIRGLGVGDERIHRLEIAARDYVSSSALPVYITVTEPDGAEDRSDLPAKLQKVFISDERITDLASLLKINIIQKLVPGLRKEGYEEQEENADDRAAREDAEAVGRRGAGRRQPPSLDPDPDVYAPPARPWPLAGDEPQPGGRPPVPAGDFPPPGFEDEYEINRPPRGMLPGGRLDPLVGPPGRSPFSIGDNDLNPPSLGPHDPLRPSFVGGGLPRPGGSGGMHPTLDDPLFGGPRGDQGFDPQAPPGARWDDPSGGGMGMGPRFGGGRPNRDGNNPFGGGFGGDII